MDLVSESVPEDYDLKKKVWSGFAPYLPGHSILTTNTSSLLPSKFKDACGAPERFLSWHFHTPVFFQNLVDVMPSPATDPLYCKILMDFSPMIGQNVVYLENEYPRYLANTMFGAIIRSALKLYLDGAASYEDIDKAWMGVRKADMGPFGLMDKVGLDIEIHVLSQDPTQTKAVEMLEKMVSQGKLGVKSGQGFYSYPNPKFEKPGFIVRPRPVPEL